MKIFTFFILLAGSLFSQGYVAGFSGGFDSDLFSKSPFENLVSAYNSQNSLSVTTLMQAPGRMSGYGLTAYYGSDGFLNYTFGYSHNTGRMVSALDPTLSYDGSSGRDIDLTIHTFSSGVSIPLWFDSFILMPSLEVGYGWMDHEIKIKGLNRTIEGSSGSIYSFAAGLGVYVDLAGPLFVFGKASYTNTFMLNGLRYLNEDTGLGRHHFGYEESGNWSAIKVQFGVCLFLFE